MKVRYSPNHYLLLILCCYAEATSPELKDLYKYMRGNPQCAIYWKEIGILLGLDANKLEIIKMDNPGNTEKCCMSMFDKWLQTDVSSSWEKFFKAFHLAIKCEVSASK